jgi:hypothetical protein
MAWRKWTGINNSIKKQSALISLDGLLAQKNLGHMLFGSKVAAKISACSKRCSRKNEIPQSKEARFCKNHKNMRTC